MTHRQELQKRYKKLVKLALAYADDGAYYTASQSLQQAADVLKAEHQRVMGIIANSRDTSQSEQPTQ